MASTNVVFLLIALTAIGLTLFKSMNLKIALAVVSICIAGVLIAFYIWRRQLLNLGALRIFELESKGIVKNKGIRNIANVIALAIMACVFYFIFNSPLNNNYVFIYVVIHIVLNLTFLTPKKLVIDYKAIHNFPSWKVKWTELLNFQLDKDKGILFLVKEDGVEIKVKGIKREDYESIEETIKTRKE